MLKKTTLIAALAVTPILGTSVVLAHGPSAAPLLQDDPAVAGGVVVSVDNDKSMFTIEVAPLEHVEVEWNDDTNFTLDGEPSTAQDVLVTDRLVSVEHHDGLAINVRGMIEEELPE
jgi:hypothetical protein